MTNIAKYFKEWMEEGQYEDDDIPVEELMDDWGKHYALELLKAETDEVLTELCNTEVGINGARVDVKTITMLTRRCGAKRLREKLIKQIEG